MATDPTPPPSKGPESSHQPNAKAVPPKPQTKKEAQGGSRPAPQARRREDNADVTRAGVIWVAISAGLIFFVLLIIFILQNQDPVTVKYFGAVGELPLGMALFIAAVGGGILVAVAGAIRIMQLRKQRRRQRATAQKSPTGSATGPAASTGKTGT